MGINKRELRKYTQSQGELAKAFRDGVESALCAILTAGDDDYWAEMELREDGNGNLAWYVELFSCPQGYQGEDTA